MTCVGDQQRQRLRRLQRLQQQLTGQQQSGGGFQQRQRRGDSLECSNGDHSREENEGQKARGGGTAECPAINASEKGALMHEAAATASRYRAFLAATRAGTASSSSSRPHETAGAPLEESAWCRTSRSGAQTPCSKSGHGEGNKQQGAVMKTGDLYTHEDVREVAAVPQPHHPLAGDSTSSPCTTPRALVYRQEPTVKGGSGMLQAKSGGQPVGRHQRRSGDTGEYGGRVNRAASGSRLALFAEDGGAVLISEQGQDPQDGSASSASDSDDSLFSSPIATIRETLGSSAGPMTASSGCISPRSNKQPALQREADGHQSMIPSGDVTIGISGISMRSVGASGMDSSGDAIVCSALCPSLDSSKLELASFDTAVSDSSFLLDGGASALEQLNRFDTRCGLTLCGMGSSLELDPKSLAQAATRVVEDMCGSLADSPPPVSAHDFATRPNSSPASSSVDETEIVEAFCLATTPARAGGKSKPAARDILGAWRGVAARATLLRDAAEAAAVGNWWRVSCMARASPWQRKLASCVLSGWAAVAAQLKRKLRMLEAALREEHLRWVLFRSFRGWAAHLAASAEAVLAAAALGHALLTSRAIKGWRDVTEVSMRFDASIIAGAREAAERRVVGRAWKRWRAAVVASVKLNCEVVRHYSKRLLCVTLRAWAVEFIDMMRERAQLKHGLSVLRGRIHQRVLVDVLSVWSDKTTAALVQRVKAVERLQASWTRFVLRRWEMITEESRKKRVAVAMRAASLLAAGWERWVTFWAREAACKAMLRHVQTAFAARVLDAWMLETRAQQEASSRALAAARLHWLSRLWETFREGCRIALQRNIRKHLADSYRARFSLCRAFASFALHAQRSRRKASLELHLLRRLSLATTRTAFRGWWCRAEWTAYKRVALGMLKEARLRRGMVAWLQACRLQRLKVVAHRRAYISNVRKALLGWHQETKLSTRLQAALLRRLLVTGSAVLRAWLDVSQAAISNRLETLSMAFLGWTQHAARAADLSRRLVIFYTISYDRTLRAAFVAFRKARQARLSNKRARDMEAHRLGSQATARWAFARWATRVAERVYVCVGVLDHLLGAAVRGVPGAWFRDSDEGKSCRYALEAWWSAARRARDARVAAGLRREKWIRKLMSSSFYAWCGFMLQSVNVLYRQHQLKQTMQDELVAVVGTSKVVAAFAQRVARARHFVAWRNIIATMSGMAFLHRLRCLGVEALREWCKHAKSTRLLRHSQTRLSDLRTRITSLKGAFNDEGSPNSDKQKPLSPLREGRLAGHLPPKPHPKQQQRVPEEESAPQSIPVHVFLNRAEFAEMNFRMSQEKVDSRLSFAGNGSVLANPAFALQASFDECATPVDGQKAGAASKTAKSATSDGYRENPVFDDENVESTELSSSSSAEESLSSCLWRPWCPEKAGQQQQVWEVDHVQRHSLLAGPIMRWADESVESFNLSETSCPHWIPNSLEQLTSDVDAVSSDDEWSSFRHNSRPLPGAARHMRRNSLFVGDH